MFFKICPKSSGHVLQMESTKSFVHKMDSFNVKIRTSVSLIEGQLMGSLIAGTRVTKEAIIRVTWTIRHASVAHLKASAFLIWFFVTVSTTGFIQVNLGGYMQDNSTETDENHCDLWPCDNLYTRCDDYWNCPNGIDELHCPLFVTAETD